MRYIPAFVIVIVLSITSLFACTKSNANVWEDTDGHTVRLADYHGKWVFINYWASWCGACAAEVPELNMFYLAHKDKDAMVYGVNYDHAPASELPMLAQRMGVMFPILINDPASQFGINSIPAIPVTLLITPNGKLQTVLVGEQTQQSLEDAMKSSSPRR